MELCLVTPDLSRLPAFVAAIERGWSPDNVSGEPGRLAILRRVAGDPERFLAAAEDPEGRAGPITLPDGRQVERLPGLQRWLWDGEFCGALGLRWTRGGAAELPAHVLGHAGYAVVPWKRGRGYATAGLRLLLPLAAAQGLPYIELTTDPDNIPSQRVILANGGRLLGKFIKPEAYGATEGLRFRIDLDTDALPRH
jgi:predicted acetyltransferase